MQNNGSTWPNTEGHNSRISIGASGAEGKHYWLLAHSILETAVGDVTSPTDFNGAVKGTSGLKISVVSIIGIYSTKITNITKCGRENEKLIWLSVQLRDQVLDIQANEGKCRDPVLHSVALALCSAHTQRITRKYKCPIPLVKRSDMRNVQTFFYSVAFTLFGFCVSSKANTLVRCFLGQSGTRPKPTPFVKRSALERVV